LQYIKLGNYRVYLAQISFSNLPSNFEDFHYLDYSWKFNFLLYFLVQQHRYDFHFENRSHR